MLTCAHTLGATRKRAKAAMAARLKFLVSLALTPPRRLTDVKKRGFNRLPPEFSHAVRRSKNSPTVSGVSAEWRCAGP